ncbi:RNA polymerase sigma factor [Intestinibacillus massiliensis]|uniref:RNA polymerase sigma factor n=1 Tax=Intestinibacillus massiliensis TaxID=1871029 RepID=UPI000B35641D|nr:sigma-70 family RNA polymerase sigma factor [Intestinibacillus massiliensis]
MNRKRDMEELVSRHIVEQTERLYRLAYSYVKNEQDAMDIVQDAAYKLLKHIDRIDSPEHIDTWVYRVTINTALDFLRKHKRTQVGLPEQEQGLPDDYSRIYVVELLQTLDEKSRAVVVLRFFEDRTLQQIADILQESLSTVKYRLYKGLGQLKQQIEQEDRHGSCL